MRRHSNKTVRSVLELHQEGLSNRGISRTLFGTDTKESTVRDILRREQGQQFELPEDITPPAVHRKKYLEVSMNAEYGKDNRRVLNISDLHFPYHHQDSLAFLAHLKQKYRPTRVICLGDECDKHSLSYHDSDPDLPSAGDELKQARIHVAELHALFPEMDILESNHGSLVWRKAKTHGIPRHYIKSYQDVLGVGKGWVWHFDMTIELPNGQHCYYHHGKSTDVLKLSQQMGMNAVQGHYHEKFKAEYWGNSTGLYWALQSGCLIDDESYAFSYNNVNLKRPIIGTTLIIDSHPVLEPMILDHNGRWIGR